MPVDDPVTRMTFPVIFCAWAHHQASLVMPQLANRASQRQLSGLRPSFKGPTDIPKESHRCCVAAEQAVPLIVNTQASFLDSPKVGRRECTTHGGAFGTDC